MEICGTKLSAARKQLLANQIDRIAKIYLNKESHIQAFIGLLCIESKFDNTARSKVGAVGIAQIMPKFASYFSEECKLGSMDAADLADTEVNLMVGACHFSKLVEALDGNIALALSGYNSGMESETTKRLAKLAEGHQETMSYIAKFYTFINKLQLAKEKQ
jgi:soluble lytic murein transglycosylase-like protein